MISLIEKPVSISITGTDPKELALLSQKFRFRPAEYWRSPSYTLFKQSKGKAGWDGYIRPLAIRSPTSAAILRGRLSELLEFSKELEIDVNGTGLYKSPLASMVVDDVPADLIDSEFELDDNQRKCICLWAKHMIGLHRMSVSSGKTATFCGAASLLKRSFEGFRFLYLTPTERLVGQVYRDANKFLPGWDITQYGGGKKDNTGEDMVVATAAMISRNIKQLGAWLQTFDCLLVDEVHHVVSPTWTTIMKSTTAKWRFGASDSMKEEDETKHNMLKGLMGRMLHNVDAKGLIDIGRIARPTIHIVDKREWNNKFSTVAHKPSPESPAWILDDDQWKKGTYLGPVFKTDEDGNLSVNRKGDPITKLGFHSIMVDNKAREIESKWCLLDRTYDRAIIRFRERNELIVRWVKYFTNKGWPTLVVCTRTLHILILQKLISEAIGDNKVDILMGQDSTKVRDDTFDWFKTTKGSCLITPLVKEGVSIPEIKAGVVADNVADWEFSNQIIGRFIRKKEGDNTAQIVWFIDRQHKNYRKTGIKLWGKLEKIKGYDLVYPANEPPV